jgi:site-specific DNA recombinase
MRTAIYARFSTELQQERSIEDQFELCRAYAAKNGLDVVGTFDDRARSGASIFGRDGLMRMMDAARDGAFDVILQADRGVGRGSWMLLLTRPYCVVERF